MKVAGIRCTWCHDVVWSRHRHDYHPCKCGACAIDGGRDYTKVTNPAAVEHVIITLNKKGETVRVSKPKTNKLLENTKMKLEDIEAIHTAMMKLQDLDTKLYKTFNESYYEAHLAEIGKTIWNDMVDLFFYSITGERNYDDFYERFDGPGFRKGKPVAWTDRFIPDTIRDTILSSKPFQDKVIEVHKLYRQCRVLEENHAIKKLNGEK